MVSALLVVAAVAASFSGPVVGVTDGDTLTVLSDSRPVTIRLAEIDAPEMGQPWSMRARQALSDKVFEQTVTVEPLTRDRFGRTVGYVRLGDREIHREMVREGHAWAYEGYLRDATLVDDEAAARADAVGLWSLPESEAVAPWRVREQARVASLAEPAVGPFACGERRYCREMRSCEEAKFHLRYCGFTRIDADGDGVPCERLCR